MKKLVIIVLLVAVALGAGYVVSAKVWGFPLFPGPEAKKSQAEKHSMYSLGTFVTNLNDPGRLIRVGIDLELENDEAARLVAARASQVKTEIYGILRAKRYLDLEGETGLKNLQKDILSRMESMFPGAVRNVFFSEFIIQ